MICFYYSFVGFEVVDEANVGLADTATDGAGGALSASFTVRLLYYRVHKHQWQVGSELSSRLVHNVSG